MQLFYASEVGLPTHTLSEEESRHAVRVLRMNQGDELYLTDGKGTMHKARISESNIKHCKVSIVETYSQYEKRPYQITMAVAPTKNNDRLEWFAEKATEVGIDTIIPVLCAHSERKVLNAERLRKVVTSAVKQSLKAYMPEVQELTPFKKLVSTAFDGVKLIAYCEDGPQGRLLIKDYVKAEDNVLILIGPEGDFSPEEIELAFANGFKPVGLGKSRLRTETAALNCVMNMAFINS